MNKSIKKIPIPSDGYLREWLCLGPFGKKAAANMGHSFIEETSAHPSIGRTEGSKKWQKIHSENMSVDFIRNAKFLGLFLNCCAYCHVYVYSPEARQVSLQLGSDDGIAVWINGDLVFKYEVNRPCVPDENSVPVLLVAGWNRILVKVTQYGGAWAFAFRLLSISRMPMTDLTYCLDDPFKSPWPKPKKKSWPAALAVTPPDFLQLSENAGKNTVEFSLTALAMSSKPLLSSIIMVLCNDVRIGEEKFLEIEPNTLHSQKISITKESWLSAWNIPLQFSIVRGHEVLCEPVLISPDPIAAFLISTSFPMNNLSDSSSGIVNTLRSELCGGWDIVAGYKGFSEALRMAVGAILLKDTNKIDACLKELDRQINEINKGSKQGAVYLAGHAHIDMNWLWRWPETVQICQDTFKQALQFIKEFPEFRFSQSQASVYEAMEKEDPVLFDGIKEAVKAGSWEITGGMWTEGDTNLSSGEALCRSFLLAQRYFREKFGVQAKTGWLPDNFGHIAQLPQILNLCGINVFYHTRCGPKAQLYWWEATDGTRVLAKTGQGYNDQVTPAIRHEPKKLPPETPSQLFVYGVGDHGGGPTRRDIKTAMSFQKSRFFPEIRFSRTEDYFNDVRKNAEKAFVHKGELQYICDGCYTTVSRIKKGNRDVENALQSTEAMAIVAGQLGLQYPAKELREAWKHLVFNQFHDILPGSATHESNADSMARYHQAMEICRQIRLRSLRFIGEKIRIENDSAIPLLVFNPLGFERDDVIVAEIVSSEKASAFSVRDTEGHEIPAQVVRARNYDIDQHYWLQFTAKAVPGIGYKLYFITLIASGKLIPVLIWPAPYLGLPPLTKTGDSRSLTRTGNKISNRFFDCAFDEKTGVITSLKLKTKGKKNVSLVEKSGANRLAIYLEKPHGASAWTLDSAPKGPIELTVAKRATVVQEGPESISWVTEFLYDKSSFALTTTVHADSQRIDCNLIVEWAERGTDSLPGPMLRVLHGLNTVPQKLVCDVPFAILDRPVGREVPAQKWVDVALKEGGLALLNTGKYGHSLDGATLRLTLLRSSYEPDVLPDVGRHEISWTLLPHETALSSAALVQAGFGVNVPFESIQLRKQEGSLGPVYSFLSSNNPSFIITGFKMAEEGDGIVLRGYDVSGKASKVQIKTGTTPASALRTNILEDANPSDDVAINDCGVTFHARPWEIVTLKLKL